MGRGPCSSRPSTPPSHPTPTPPPTDIASSRASDVTRRDIFRTLPFPGTVGGEGVVELGWEEGGVSAAIMW